jgi:hypothetical protein
MAARVEEERERTTPTRASTTTTAAAAQGGTTGATEVSLTQFRAQFPGWVSVTQGG